MTMHYDNYVVTLSRQNHVSDMYRKYQIPLHSTAHMYRKVRFIDIWFIICMKMPLY